MTDQDKTVYQGLVIQDDAFLGVHFGQTDVRQASRELVANSIQADATVVEISFNERGYMTVADNGRGLSLDDMKLFFKGLGSGHSKRGIGKNYGIGLRTLPYILKAPIVVESRVKGTDSKGWIRAQLSRNSGEGFRAEIGNKPLNRAPAGSASFNTVVTCQTDRLSPREILRFLNQRLQSIPAGVEV